MGLDNLQPGDERFVEARRVPLQRAVAQRGLEQREQRARRSMLQLREDGMRHARCSTARRAVAPAPERRLLFRRAAGPLGW